MKKGIAGFTICLLPLFLAACQLFSSGNGSSGNEEKPNPNPGTDKTWVCFINRNDFSVAIFSDRSRLIQIAEAAAQGQSAPVQTDPNSGGALFYPTYNIIIEDALIPFEGEVIIARVDEGKTPAQPNIVTIPSLEELGEAELAKPLSTAAYLKIQNSGTSSLTLRRGSVELQPERSNSPILNGGETGLYLITPGPVSGYSLRRNTTVPVDFPGTVTEFASARLYSFRFDGANLGLLAEKRLTLAQVFALSPPENINARALPSGSIALSWDRVGTETSYKIYRAEETPDSFSLLASVNTTSYTDAAVVLGKTYYYKLASIKNNLESEKSVNYVSILAELAALSAPAGLNAVSLGTDSIMLSWNPVADAAAYKINRGFDEETVTTYVGTTASASYTVNGLSAGTGYYFTVSAINDFAESLPSNPVYGMTSQVPAIQPPAVVNASSLGNSSIQVSWNAVSGATGYKVYRASSSAGSYIYRADVYSTSYTDSGLSEGSTWYYKVSSVKDSQESAMSSSYASATTQSGSGTIDYPPVMPTGLVVSSVYSGSITLSWNSVSTATSYNVYRSNTQTGAEAKINTSPVTGTSYTDNVPSGAAYYYKVAGVNSSGESPKSAGAFAYAASHYTLSYYDSAQTLSLAASSKHYYRLSVTQGSSYTIEWQNGSNQNYGRWDELRVSAWQNNGTSIFSGAYDGYTSPRIFTATATGFVTVEVSNNHSSASYNYQVYYY